MPFGHGLSPPVPSLRRHPQKIQQKTRNASVLRTRCRLRAERSACGSARRRSDPHAGGRICPGQTRSGRAVTRSAGNLSPGRGTPTKLRHFSELVSSPALHRQVRGPEDGPAMSLFASIKCEALGPHGPRLVRPLRVPGIATRCRTVRAGDRAPADSRRGRVRFGFCCVRAVRKSRPHAGGSGRRGCRPARGRRQSPIPGPR